MQVHFWYTKDKEYAIFRLDILDREMRMIIMAKRVMTPVKMIECDQVRGFRIKLGMTQKEFADATGLAASTIKKIETYKTSVTYKSKTCISEYLENNGFPCEWYDADVNGDADVYTAVSGLMQGNSAYILEISDCIE